MSSKAHRILSGINHENKQCPIQPLDDHVFKLDQIGQNTTGDEQLKHAVNLLSTLEYWKMSPHNEIVSGSMEAYCLAEPARQYVVYAPEGGSIRIQLPAGSYHTSWFHPYSGNIEKTSSIITDNPLKIGSADNNDQLLVIKN